MAEACERAGVVLMEAYMTPFHPRSRFIDAVLTSGELGARRGFAAFTFPLDAGNHRWRRDAGGGALLDLGIYCVEPLLLAGGGLPDRITASAIRGGDGVDATFQGRLDFPSGFVGDVLCSFEMPFVQSLTVFGTSASLAADRPFNPKVEETTVTHSERGVVTFAAADCYRGLVDHFCGVVRGEATLSRPPSASVRLLEVLDRLRTAAGLDPAA
jgi:predicted dehydrogenase